MKITITSMSSESNESSEKKYVVTGPIILYRNPVEPNEAATKNYVDSSFSNLNASKITTGIIPKERLPAFTGNITSVSGTNNLMLQTTGVTPGTYTKVTVDSKGRVTNGSSLSPYEIPNFNWNKITNKPTTLAGYGITDALKITGGTVTGYISLNDPVNPSHAATKRYVDNVISSSSGLSVGDIIRRPSSTTPPGFLRCNGAEVPKTTYANLYAVIGDTYNSNTTDPNKFRIPDLSQKEEGIPFYIKY